MKIEIRPGVLDVAYVSDFAPLAASDADIEQVKSLVYSNKMVILKNQELTPEQYLQFAQRMGTPEQYYQPMYHHPEVPEIFVSSSVPKEGGQIGVPRTGKFWHADYQFKAKPFAFTFIYPQVVPKQNRGTYFIDMGRVFRELPEALQQRIGESYASHSVRRYFKIRPGDIYRPLGEIIAEVESETPEVRHPTTFVHPVTGETVLYISAGFTHRIESEAGVDLGKDLLDELLGASGQGDETYQHPNIHLQTFEEGDLMIWDNRSLVHCALHAPVVEPAETFRITLHDHAEFYAGVGY